MPRRHPFPSDRQVAGFTLVELLVVIAIIGILIGLLLPAVQKAREASNRARCQNNLKQYGLAFHSYHDGYKKLPPGGIAWTCRGPNYLMTLLPFLEQENLARRLDYKEFPFEWPNITSTQSTSPLATPLPIYSCPSDRRESVMKYNTSYFLARGNYALNLDLGTASPDAPFAIHNSCGPTGWVKIDARGLSSSVIYSFDRITDGLSTTLFMSEMLTASAEQDSSTRADLRGNIYSNGTTMAGMSFSTRIAPNAATDVLPNWFVPPNYQCTNSPPFLPCSTSGGSSDWWTAARSKHPGGVSALFGDGSVRFAPNGVNTSIWRGAGTKSGGESVAVNF